MNSMMFSEARFDKLLWDKMNKSKFREGTSSNYCSLTPHVHTHIYNLFLM